MTQISSYYAKVSLSTDMAALKKVDRYLKLLEAKLAKFHKKAMKTGGVFNIKLAIDDKALIKNIGNALDKASNKVTMEIKNFHVNQQALGAALRRASAGTAFGVGGRGGFAGRPALSSQEWDRRRAVTQLDRLENMKLRQQAIAESHRQKMELAQFRANNAPARAPFTARHAGFAGGTAGFFGRYGAPAIIGGASLYGGAMLNRANQEIVSAQLTTQAVVEAQGLKGQGPAAFEWLRSQGNRIGFSYLDQAQDYNNFLSNSLGAGRTLDQAQNTYLGFAEYARAMGTSPARQKLVMNALSQMEAKGTVSMEELRRQMAESMPGTMSVFAEALQRQTGGNLQGQAAMQALMEAVPAGQVKSDILPIVAEILRERAKPKLDVAMKTSQAEQARAVNLLTDFTNIASKAGLEEGFSRIFRTFTDGLSESAGLVKSLAEGFNTATKFARDFLLIPQSISRMFEGKDSVVADWLFGQGEDGTKMLAFAYEMRDLMSNLNDLAHKAAEGWQMIFDVINNNSSIFDRMTAGLNTVNLGLNTVKSLTEGDSQSAKETGKGFFKGYLDMVSFLPRQIPDLVTGGAISGYLGLGGENKTDSMRRAGETLVKQQMNQSLNVTLNVDGVFQSQQEATIAGNALAEQFVNSVKEFQQSEYEKTLQMYPQTQ